MNLTYNDVLTNDSEREALVSRVSVVQLTGRLIQSNDLVLLTKVSEYLKEDSKTDDLFREFKGIVMQREDVIHCFCNNQDIFKATSLIVEKELTLKKYS